VPAEAFPYIVEDWENFAQSLRAGRVRLNFDANGNYYPPEPIRQEPAPQEGQTNGGEVDDPTIAQVIRNSPKQAADVIKSLYQQNRKLQSDAARAQKQARVSAEKKRAADRVAMSSQKMAEEQAVSLSKLAEKMGDIYGNIGGIYAEGEEAKQKAKGMLSLVQCLSEINENLKDRLKGMSESPQKKADARLREQIQYAIEMISPLIQSQRAGKAEKE